MTISSRFYTGFVDNIEWAESVRRVPFRYAVGDVDDFRVEIDPTGTRRVKILANGAHAFGGGIEDTADADELFTFDSPGSGSRWELIGLRRTWGATNATVIDNVTGTATKQLPARPMTPGVEDFQPLALVQITFGEALPTAIVDLRAVADNAGLLVAFDDLARSYLDAPGTILQIGVDTQWVSAYDTNGNQEWIRQWLATVPAGAPTYDTGWRAMEKTTGWEDVPGSPAQFRRVGNVVSVRGKVRRSSLANSTEAVSPCYIPSNSASIHARPSARYDTSGMMPIGDFRMWIDPSGLISTGLFPEPTNTVYVAMTFIV